MDWVGYLFFNLGVEWIWIQLYGVGWNGGWKSVPVKTSIEQSVAKRYLWFALIRVRMVDDIQMKWWPFRSQQRSTGPQIRKLFVCPQGWRNDSRGGGTRPWGPPRKRGHKCLKGPKTTYTTIAIAEKQSKRSKKGPFSLYIGPTGSHPGNEINGARRGRSLPVPPPGFSSHVSCREKNSLHSYRKK